VGRAGGSVWKLLQPGRRRREEVVSAHDLDELDTSRPGNSAPTPITIDRHRQSCSQPSRSTRTSEPVGGVVVLWWEFEIYCCRCTQITNSRGYSTVPDTVHKRCLIGRLSQQTSDSSQNLPLLWSIPTANVTDFPHTIFTINAASSLRPVIPQISNNNPPPPSQDPTSQMRHDAKRSVLRQRRRLHRAGRGLAHYTHTSTT
jgi:hypothetical protein